MKTNTTHIGDCLRVMQTLPEGCVDLIYLDPPYNTGKEWTDTAGSYSDKFGEATETDKAAANKIARLATLIETIAGFNDESYHGYLYFMSARLIECRRVLKDTGSIYLHIDNRVSHALRCVMDAIFGVSCFRNEVIWHYGKWTNTAKHWQRNHDVLLFYTKGRDYIFNKQYGAERNGTTVHKVRGYNLGLSKGKRVLKVYDKNNPKAMAKIQQGDYDTIYYIKEDDAEKGVAVSDCWDIDIINPKAKERVGYPTQKPLDLLYRIIKASSNEDDIVLDPFCGSGTALVAAAELGRRYIGIDISEDANNATMKRIQSRLL